MRARDGRRAGLGTVGGRRSRATSACRSTVDSPSGSTRVLAVLRRVRVDAALLLHDGGAPTSERIAAAEEHLRRWLLLDAARARRVVDSLARPLWRAHVVASVEGTAIVGRWLEQGPDPVDATPSAARHPGRSRMRCAAERVL